MQARAAEPGDGHLPKAESLGAPIRESHLDRLNKADCQETKLPYTSATPEPQASPNKSTMGQESVPRS